ncbi:hypothetical protein CPB84DRAFT_1791837 [Gymnopilus junonius]|uniref:Uncharacterized protein n=1 Tax=Gymnopilus junonius TaxID=109634 RepID=A0A9P5TJ51_GYMJU|nr:hypothetical protein CPB84DRAFT_1791837 [Gymnopilus junonius]
MRPQMTLRFVAIPQAQSTSQTIQLHALPSRRTAITINCTSSPGVGTACLVLRILNLNVCLSRHYTHHHVIYPPSALFFQHAATALILFRSVVIVLIAHHDCREAHEEIWDDEDEILLCKRMAIRNKILTMKNRFSWLKELRGRRKMTMTTLSLLSMWN